MQTETTGSDWRWQRRLSVVFGLYALIAGAISFGGWMFDIPRMTDWLNDGISVQPNACVLIALSGVAVVLRRFGHVLPALALGGLVATVGGVNLLQYIMDTDLGFNHQLLFGRSWGRGATAMPGRFGPPASISFILIGMSFVLLGARDNTLRRYVPIMALLVMVLMMFALLGYLFGARNFYAIPWLSAIALPTSTMLMALAMSLIVSVPERQPMLLLCERSGAGTMARTVLPILVVMIPLVTWLRVQGYELEMFDLGTSRALSAAVLILGVVGLMWIALLAVRRRELSEREADRRKDEFLATLAHELRNPLAPIRNATSILKLAHNDRGVFDQAIETIERQMAHLVRLIDDLLDMSRISRGKLELRREHMELASVVHQAVETCRPMAQAAHQELTVALPPQPIYLDADPVRLSQVISNLLNNACKFAGDHGRINLTVERQDDNALIIVRDNGIGITPEKIDAIFEMFWQVDQSLERSQGGLGIGLTLAKRLVELHGGTIGARSDGLGKGSQFIVRLPVAADAVAPKPKEPEHGAITTGKKRILIVDDNQDSAESLATLLKLTGNEISVAHDGEQAVLVASRERPEVILLDIGLPKMNGFDACRRIRENAWAENVLIIALTGWGQEEDRRRSAEAGFDGHLVKPVDLEELMRLLVRQSV